MRSYWAYVWYDANKAAWRWVVGHIGAAVISVGVLAAGLVGLWGWGSADGFRDQAIVLGAGLFAMALTYAAILTAQLLMLPPRLHADQTAEIQRLGAVAHSPLAFEIETQGGRWSSMHPDRMDCYISVRNLSTTQTVDDLRVILEWHSSGRESRTQAKEAVLSLQFEDRMVTSIPPTGIRHFRLCAILEAPWPPPPAHTFVGRVVFAPQADLVHAPKYAIGTYEIHVRAEARDTRPVPAVYVLQVLDTMTTLTLEPSKIGSDWPSLHEPLQGST